MEINDNLRSVSDIKSEITKLEKDQKFLYELYKVSNTQKRDSINLESWYKGESIKILKWVLGNEYNAKKHYE